MTSRFNPRYDKWVWAIIIGVPVVILGWGILLTALGEDPAFFVVLGASVFTGLLLWTVLPRSYDLWPDRVRIVLGWGWGLNIPLDTIAEVRLARRIDALARIHRCGAALGLEQGVRAVGRDGPRSIPINGAGGGLWLELVAPMAVLGSGAGAGSAGQHAREDNRGPGRCDSVGWLSSLVDVSGAVGAVRQAMAGLAIEPGRE